MSKNKGNKARAKNEKQIFQMGTKMKTETRIYSEIFCVHCGGELEGRDAWVIQDDQGHDLLSGFLCWKCEPLYDDEGKDISDDIVANAISSATEDYPDLASLDDPYPRIAAYLGVDGGYATIWPPEDGEKEHQWAGRVEENVSAIWSRM